MKSSIIQMRMTNWDLTIRGILFAKSLSHGHMAMITFLTAHLTPRRNMVFESIMLTQFLGNKGHINMTLFIA